MERFGVLFLCVLFICLGLLVVPTISDESPSLSVIAKKSVLADKQNGPTVPTVKPIDDNVSHKDNNTNSTVLCQNDNTKNSSKCIQENAGHGSFMKKVIENKAMLIRTMYVLVALTSIVVVYFMVRWIRLKHKRNKSRKYGLITAPNDLEMAPLDQEDDDEDDMTVFELNGQKK